MEKRMGDFSSCFRKLGDQPFGYWNVEAALKRFPPETAPHLSMGRVWYCSLTPLKLAELHHQTSSVDGSDAASGADKSWVNHVSFLYRRFINARGFFKGPARLPIKYRVAICYQHLY